MKFLNIILLFFIFYFFIPLTVSAEIIPDTIYAVSPEYLSYENLNTNDSIYFYVLKTGVLSNDLNLKENEKIELKIVNYVPPKRGKRNGFYNIKYGIYYTGTMRASTPKDFKEIAKTAGTTIAGTVLKIPGFSQALAVSKGLILPNENQSRIKSAGENLYKSTPLKYIEKWENFAVEQDGIVVIKLKSVL